MVALVHSAARRSTHCVAALLIAACCSPLALKASDTVEHMIAQGRYAQALPALEEARETAESAGRRDAEVAILLNNLGSVYYELGRHRDARNLFERSLVMWRDLGETDTTAVTRTLNNLGAVYLKLHLLQKAEETLTQASALEEKLSGNRDDVRVARAWASLGQVYQAERRWADAENLFRKALAVREREQGPNHRDVASALNNLAVLLQDSKRFEEAEPLLERALRIWEDRLGSDHPLVAAASHNLAVLYTQVGRTREAETYFKRAIRIASVALPPDHPNTAAYMDSYAVLLRRLGRKDEAGRLEKSAKLARERYRRNNLIGYTVDARQLREP
jgi:tetratricopeptide (TPR) repeat protein